MGSRNKGNKNKGKGNKGKNKPWKSKSFTGPSAALIKAIATPSKSSGGGGGGGKNNPYGGNKGSKKINPKDYKGSAGKNKYINQITADGKINKYEAKNAASLGISQAKIQSTYDRNFKSGANSSASSNTLTGKYSNLPKGPPGLYNQSSSTSKGYSPLVIGNKASQILSPPQIVNQVPAPVTETTTDGTYNPEPLVPNNGEDTGFDLDAFTSSLSGYFDNLFSMIDEAQQPPSVIYNAPLTVGGYAGSIAPGRAFDTTQNQFTFGANALGRDSRTDTDNNTNLSITGLNI